MVLASHSGTYYSKINSKVLKRRSCNRYKPDQDIGSHPGGYMRGETPWVSRPGHRTLVSATVALTPIWVRRRCPRYWGPVPSPRPHPIRSQFRTDVLPVVLRDVTVRVLVPARAPSPVVRGVDLVVRAVAAVVRAAVAQAAAQAKPGARPAHAHGAVRDLRRRAVLIVSGPAAL